MQERCSLCPHQLCPWCGQSVTFSPRQKRRYDAHGIGPHYCVITAADFPSLIECCGCGLPIWRDGQTGQKMETISGDPHLCSKPLPLEVEAYQQPASNVRTTRVERPHADIMGLDL